CSGLGLSRCVGLYRILRSQLEPAKELLQVELVYLGAHRALQRIGLGVNLHLGMHRAAGQLKGRGECQVAIMQAQLYEELLQRYLGGYDLVTPETQAGLKSLRPVLDLFLHRGRYLDVLWFHTPRFFLRLIACQLINHQGLRLQISMQYEMLTTRVE